MNRAYGKQLTLYSQAFTVIRASIADTFGQDLKLSVSVETDHYQSKRRPDGRQKKAKQDEPAYVKLTAKKRR